MSKINQIEKQKQQQETTTNFDKPETIISFGKELRPFVLYADFTNADKRFEEKYGDIVSRIQYRDLNTNKFISSDQKAWFRFDTDKRKAIQKTDDRGVILKGYEYQQEPTEAYRKLLKHSNTFLPHEAAGEQFLRATDNINKNLEFGQLKMLKVKESHNGFSKYWEILSDKRHDVAKGDIVQFGISLRNGIGTGIALGGDMFSYRLICSNGAVARNPSLGSFSIIHKGTPAKMLDELVEGISNIFATYSKLLKYYKVWNETKLTQTKLAAIVKKLDFSVNYLPTSILDIKTRKDDKTIKKPIIKLKDENATYWDLFNGVTEPLTKALNAGKKRNVDDADTKKITYSIFAKRTGELHRALIANTPLIVAK